MLTNEDIQKIIEVVATKDDVSGLKQDISKLGVEIVVTKSDVSDLKQDMSALKELVQGLIISVDRLVKAIDDLRTEYVAMTSQLNRHEKWLHQVAEKLGIKLEY